jgi:hypothetical protein
MWSAAKEGLILGFVQQVPQRVVLAVIFSYPFKKKCSKQQVTSHNPLSLQFLSPELLPKSHHHRCCVLLSPSQATNPSKIAAQLRLHEWLTAGRRLAHWFTQPGRDAGQPAPLPLSPLSPPCPQIRRQSTSPLLSWSWRPPLHSFLAPVAQMERAERQGSLSPFSARVSPQSLTTVARPEQEKGGAAPAATLATTSPTTTDDSRSAHWFSFQYLVYSN